VIRRANEMGITVLLVEQTYARRSHRRTSGYVYRRPGRSFGKRARARAERGSAPGLFR